MTAKKKVRKMIISGEQKESALSFDKSHFGRRPEKRTVGEIVDGMEGRQLCLEIWARRKGECKNGWAGTEKK